MRVLPIQDLINRIHWDRDFARAEFDIVYLDREEGLVRLPLRMISFQDEDHFFFHFTDDEGRTHSVPLHRVRKVFRNGELIWERPA